MASPHERVLTLQVKRRFGASVWITLASSPVLQKTQKTIYIFFTRFGAEEPCAPPPSSLTLLGFLMRFIHLSETLNGFHCLDPGTFSSSLAEHRDTFISSPPRRRLDLWPVAQSCTVGPFCAGSDAAEVRSIPFQREHLGVVRWWSESGTLGLKVSSAFCTK